MKKSAPVQTLEGSSKKLIKPKNHEHLESFNPVETSKMILENCNCILRRGSKAKVLHQGEGKLISTADMTVKEVYSSIFNKSRSIILHK